MESEPKPLKNQSRVLTPSETVDNAYNTENLNAVYEQSDSPWIDSRGNISENVSQLVSQIQQSVFHGLNPQNYDLEKILELQESLNATNLSLKGRRHALSKLEAALDDSYYKLAKHLGSSLIEGRDVQDYIFRSSPTPELNTFYQSVSSGERTIDEVFDAIAPTHTDYVELQRALGNLMHEKGTGLSRTQVPATELLSAGDEHETVRAAKLRLLETGDYSGESGVDSSFDEFFKEAVISFQTRHHISPTGAGCRASWASNVLLPTCQIIAFVCTTVNRK